MSLEMEKNVSPLSTPPLLCAIACVSKERERGREERRHMPLGSFPHAQVRYVLVGWPWADLKIFFY